MEKIFLPAAFTKRMREILTTEYEDFERSYESNRFYGLRCNLLKCSAEAFPALYSEAFGQSDSLEGIPWAPEGFFFMPEDQPGRHPLHEAGAYYIQEPSAMSSAAVLDPKPGERVLDLCAAPGGKTTQIAARMQGSGLLVSNEIVSSRARILSQNVERMGIRNCVVLNETPDRLAGFFPEFFDCILVDAPCSGEGMFRKEEAALSQWSVANVKMCADRQDLILEAASRMLRPGGRLVYSTCTFAPEEDEGSIDRFLDRHPDFHVVSSPLQAFFDAGRPDLASSGRKELELTMRLWPHKIEGEGHFVALLKKDGQDAPEEVILPGVF